MRERYIAPIIMLVACAITSALNIIDEIDFFDGLLRLLITLIIFLIIGKIVTKIIMKTVSINIESIEPEKSIQTNEGQLSENEADINE